MSEMWRVKSPEDLVMEETLRTMGAAPAATRATTAAAASTSMRVRPHWDVA
jgi:hypothetical protein